MDRIHAGRTVRYLNNEEQSRFKQDDRQRAARYYDLKPNNPQDIDFYIRQVPSETAGVLELGCGTGRVLTQLVDHCGFIQGVDRSESMLEICREKLARRLIPEARAKVLLGDASSLKLQHRFDLITAPFRVFQNLESESQVDGFFGTVQVHLSPDAKCIITAFRPNRERNALFELWSSTDEVFNWEVPFKGGRLTRHHRNTGFDDATLTVYPELVYRMWDGTELVDEAVMKIAMRCFYPDELIGLVEECGFVITDTWGGYADEEYGEGSELVVKFGL